VSELGESKLSKGPGSYHELNAHDTAFKLFSHLKKGDKVAITSRYNNEYTQAFVSAFKERGIQARVIEGGSAKQDFCFLTYAKKELVGSRGSTYVKWAGLLGNATKVRLYSLNPKDKNQPFGWSHPDLVQTFSSVYFDADPIQAS